MPRSTPAAAGLTHAEQAELKELRKEVRELRRSNDILQAAATFFGAELDRRQEEVVAFIDAHRDNETGGRRWGVEPICAELAVALHLLRRQVPATVGPGRP